MKKILTICIVFLMALVLGCDKSENINNNLRRSEGNFEVYRRVTVVNIVSDKILFEVTRLFSN